MKHIIVIIIFFLEHMNALIFQEKCILLMNIIHK